MLDSSDKPNGGFKGFNSTGREDTTTEVLRPRLDAAASKRRVTLIAVVIIAVCVLGYVAFQRSGLTFSSTENTRSFGPGEQKVD